MYPLIEDSDIQRFEPMMDIIDRKASGERVPPQTTMRYEMLRFCTLRSFPKENKPFITKIAAAGFYYANTGDEVVCYTCARRKNNWLENDDPMEIHRKLNPSCAFLLKNLEVNVPVKASILSNNSTSSNGKSVSSPLNETVAPNSQNLSTTNETNNDDTRTNNYVSNNDARSANKNGFLQSSACRTGIVNDNFRTNTQIQKNRAYGSFSGTNSVLSTQVHHHPAADNSGNQQSISPLAESGSQASLAKYPRYASMPVRLQSYHDCGNVVKPPDSLARAGFFYAGFGDLVRCFQCGVGLRHWSEEDDPWIEHSRWSKECLFVRQVRGQEFVNLVQMAEQYSQTQNGNDPTPGSGKLTGSNTEFSADTDIERQMQTDAAQSVLKMGYNPDIIRNALRAINKANAGQALNAYILLEKIFELEDEAPAFAENNQPIQGSLNKPTHPTHETVCLINNDTQGQRISIESRSTASSTIMTQSRPFGRTSSSAATTANSSTVRHLTSSDISIDGTDDIWELSSENRRLRDQLFCRDCKVELREVLFLSCPSPHLLFCNICYLCYDICPVCNTPIRALMNVERQNI